MPAIPLKHITLMVFFMGISLHCQAQRVPEYTRKQFTNCISGDPSGLSARLDLHGFYQYHWYHHTTYGYGKAAITVDSLRQRILFYEDGSFVTNFDLIPAARGANPDSVSPVVDSASYPNATWGRFRLSGDTIICQWLYPARRSGVGVGGWESRYRIIGRHEIELLPAAKRPLYRMSKSERRAFDEEARKERYSTARLSYMQQVPRVNSWLNAQSWIRCN